MKRSVIFLFVLFLCLGISSADWALAYTETFLGTKGDNDFFAMAEKNLLDGPFAPPATVGYKAEFAFQLDAPGGNARLFNVDPVTGADVMVRNDLPTNDVNEPGIVSQTINAASMNFNFTSEDTDLERIWINIKIPGPDPDATVFDGTFDVYRLAAGGFDFSLDLVATGMLDALVDGRITSVALAPAADVFDNSFLLHQVSLQAEVTPVNPVPIPAAIVLFGSGLIGIAGLKRKFKKC